MKGRKATREERKIISAAGLDTYAWLVQKHTVDFMQLINKNTGEVRRIEI